MRQEVASLEIENKEQGLKLQKLDEGVTYMREIKLLREDERMWKSKNEKIEAE